jgi:hypothetical protein
LALSLCEILTAADEAPAIDWIGERAKADELLEIRKPPPLSSRARNFLEEFLKDGAHLSGNLACRQEALALQTEDYNPRADQSDAEPFTQ